MGDCMRLLCACVPCSVLVLKLRDDAVSTRTAGVGRGTASIALQVIILTCNRMEAEFHLSGNILCYALRIYDLLITDSSHWGACGLADPRHIGEEP